MGWTGYQVATGFELSDTRGREKGGCPGVGVELPGIGRGQIRCTDWVRCPPGAWTFVAPTTISASLHCRWVPLRKN
jgi:hypothetical protein